MAVFFEANDGFELSVTNLSRWPANSRGLHFHDVYEFYYLLHGKINYIVQGETFTLEPGDIILIPPYATHKTQPDGKEAHQRILFTIPKNMLQEIFEKSNFKNISCDSIIFFHPTNSQQNNFRKYVNLLCENYYLHKNDNEYLTKCLLSLVFFQLDNMGNDVAALDLNKNFPSSLYKIINYIEVNYQDNISLKDLSEMVFLTEEYICSLFKKHLDISFKEFLIQTRINVAKKLLSTTNLSSKQIAFKCGFTSSNHFCKVFKKEVELSPLTFRELSKQQPTNQSI